VIVMADDDYSQRMYERAKRKRELLEEIDELRKLIEGIDKFTEYPELTDRDVRRYLKRRDMLFKQREALIAEYKSL